MIHFKQARRKLVFAIAAMVPMVPTLANTTVHVRQSVAFDNFSDDTQYVEIYDGDPEGHHTSGEFPQTIPPQDPVHNDDDKFQMRCQSDDWDKGNDIHCKLNLTVDMTWNQNNPAYLKQCRLVVTLGAKSDSITGGFGKYSKSREYNVTGDCALDEKTFDGVDVWVVHPKTIIQKRSTSATFQGQFTQTQAATWAQQIYQNLSPDIKAGMKDYKASYELSADGTALTFSIPSYYESHYTCKDWC